MSAAGSIMIDRKTFFIGLLLAVAVMLAGTFIVTRMMQDRGGEPRGPQPARPMPPPPMQLVKSPHIVDVETDIEGVNALAARGAPKVILVHAPWCGHCRNMMPAFVEAAAAERSVTWMRIDGNVAPSVVRREDLHGFPTIYGVLRDGTVTQHDGGRDVRSLLEFARKVAQAGASHADAAPVVTFAAAPRETPQAQADDAAAPSAVLAAAHAVAPSAAVAAADTAVAATAAAGAAVALQ